MLKKIFGMLMLSLYLEGTSPITDVSESDRLKLELFFDTLFQHSSIGYSLCGEKPMAIEYLPVLSKLPGPIAAFIFFDRYFYFILGKNLECWEKHSDKFLSKHFAFYHSKQSHFLLFINKRACQKVITSNIDLFHKYLTPDLPAESIVEGLCDETLVKQILKNHILAGVLFGYGRNNAIAFANGNYLQNLEDAYELRGFAPLLSFQNVGFKIINNGTNISENRAVLGKFANANKMMQKNFQRGHYFEKFVELYTQD